MKVEERQWKPQDLLNDLQSIIDGEPDRYLNTRRLTLCMARDYLKEYFSLSSNDPLTLEDLRDMDGEPVWSARWGVWGLVDIGLAAVITQKGNLDINDEAIHERLYRRKPEEGTA